MISIVIPLGRGSRWNDMELRYSLRSFEKHLHEFGEVFIIGACPHWLKNVIHIPATDGDQSHQKERNIFQKIMLACHDERVTEDFLFANDDHFLSEDVIAENFPYHYCGFLDEAMKRTDPYRQTIENTHRLFPQGRNFDTHCPIVYNKQKFVNQVSTIDWSVKWGYGIKTVYCEANGIEGEFYPDLKIDDPIPASTIRQLIKGRPYFSMGNRGREGGLPGILQELYPLKSKYEK